jgi:hypothetical protein
VLFDATVAQFRASGLARQQAEDAIGVAYAGHFRIDHHHGAIGKVHGQRGTFLDTGGRVADDVIEAFFAQAVENLFHAFPGQRILVAGLRGGEHEQAFVALVLDQRLLERAFAVDDVDEVIDHTTLAAHDQVEVAQADIEIDDGNLFFASGQAHGQRRAGRGLADPAFSRCDDDDLSQCPVSRLALVFRTQPSLARCSFSPSSQACTGWPRRSDGRSSNTRYWPAMETSSA